MLLNCFILHWTISQSTPIKRFTTDKNPQSQYFRLLLWTLLFCQSVFFSLQFFVFTSAEKCVFGLLFYCKFSVIENFSFGVFIWRMLVCACVRVLTFILVSMSNSRGTARKFIVKSHSHVNIYLVNILNFIKNSLINLGQITENNKTFGFSMKKCVFFKKSCLQNRIKSNVLIRTAKMPNIFDISLIPSENAYFNTFRYLCLY